MSVVEHDVETPKIAYPYPLVRLSLSAAWPTEDLNPFLRMYTFITRSRLGEDESLPQTGLHRLGGSTKNSFQEAFRLTTNSVPRVCFVVP